MPDPLIQLLGLRFARFYLIHEILKVDWDVFALLVDLVDCSKLHLFASNGLYVLSPVACFCKLLLKSNHLWSDVAILLLLLMELD